MGGAGQGFLGFSLRNGVLAFDVVRDDEGRPSRVTSYPSHSSTDGCILARD